MIDYATVLREVDQQLAKLTVFRTALAALVVFDPPPSRNGTRPKPPTKPAPTSKPNGQVKAAAPGKDWHAKADQLLAQGKSVKEVAASCGVTDSAIYLHRKTRGTTVATSASKPKRNGPTPTAFRCQACGHMGTDPVRCENVNCREKR